MDTPSPEALASTVYALSDLDGRGAGNPITMPPHVVLRNTVSLPRS